MEEACIHYVLQYVLQYVTARICEAMSAAAAPPSPPPPGGDPAPSKGGPGQEAADEEEELEEEKGGGLDLRPFVNNLESCAGAWGGSKETYSYGGVFIIRAMLLQHHDIVWAS